MVKDSTKRMREDYGYDRYWKEWTEKEEKEARRLWKNGRSCEEICDEIGRPMSAIADRMELTSGQIRVRKMIWNYLIEDNDVETFLFNYHQLVQQYSNIEMMYKSVVANDVFRYMKKDLDRIGRQQDVKDKIFLHLLGE